MNKKQEQIIKATAKLFMKYGIRSVTMDEVAKELTISKKTLYQFFKDKTDLVNYVVEFMGDKSDISHCGEDKNLNAVEKHISVYNKVSAILTNANPSFEYDLQKYYPKQFKKMIKTRRNSMFEKMKRDLQQGVDEGFFRADMDVEKVAILNLIRIESIKDNEIIEKYNLKLIDMIQEFFDYHLHAIATEKGIKEYANLLSQEK